MSLVETAQMNRHHDYPHAVPAIAKLRWKENWLFVVLAPEADVFGILHVNSEPMFDRMRLTLNLNVSGRQTSYVTQLPFPTDWENQHRLGDDSLSFEIVEPGQSYSMRFDTDVLEGEIHFAATHPMFDFTACREQTSNLSFREVMTLGTNLPHDHQQQALASQGRVRLKDSGQTIVVDGLGYRDHSWCMRADTEIAEHSWCALIFDDWVVGVKTAKVLIRPDAEACEAYLSDSAGQHVLPHIRVNASGTGPDGLGSEVRFELGDESGRHFTIVADVSNRLSHVPHVSEKPGAAGSYKIIENMCRIECVETGEVGLGHIELGRNPLHDPAP